MIFFVIALTNFTLEMLLWPSYFSKRSNSWLGRKDSLLTPADPPSPLRVTKSYAI